MASICVFCGSRSGTDVAFPHAAARLGRFLAQNQHTTVFGGGSVGLMGVLADAVLASGGDITGVIPRHLARTEIMHAGVSDMRVTADMHQRKALMHSLTDCYVTLPGGFGTMEEMFEAVTWAQLDLHQRPIVVLNLQGIYDGLLQLIGDMSTGGFLSSDCVKLVHVVNSDTALFDWISNAFPMTSHSVRTT